VAGGLNGFVATGLYVGTVGQALSFEGLTWDRPGGAGWFFDIDTVTPRASLNLAFKNLKTYQGTDPRFNGWRVSNFNPATVVYENNFFDGTGSRFGGTFSPGASKHYAITPQLAINAGNAGAYTLVDLSAFVPKDAKVVWGWIQANTAQKSAYLAPALNGDGYIFLRVPTGGDAAVTQYWLPLLTTQSLWYKVDAGGTATIGISGYGF
jgi:hypothetical protein